MDRSTPILIHPLSEVEPGADIGRGTQVWRWSLIRSSCLIGMNVKIGSHVVLGPRVTVQDDCKIEDGAKIYGPCILGRQVFIGPNAVICNDRNPSAIEHNWEPNLRLRPTYIGDGASLGANAVVMPGVRIGAGAIVGAGAVVTHDVDDRATVVGVPARGNLSESFTEDLGGF